MFKKEYFSSLNSWDETAGKFTHVYIYGMGSGGEKILNLCKQKNIAVEGFCCSDEFARGKTFHGFKVEPISKICSRQENICLLLGFGTSLKDVMEKIELLEQPFNLLAPEVSVIGGEGFSKEKFMAEFSKAEFVRNLLTDKLSKEVFDNLICYKITGKLGFLRKCFELSSKDIFPISLTDQEIYCDLGAYNGDTVEEFIKRTNGSYKAIYAMEPDKRNFQKCLKNCLNYDNIFLYNYAAWNYDGKINFSKNSGRQACMQNGGTKTESKKIPCQSLDSILNGKECSYIKYDVEGADIAAIRGSSRTIKKFSPKICCGVYHRCYDFIDIPIEINKINSSYKFSLRQSPYYPAWETNIFAYILQ